MCVKIKLVSRILAIQNVRHGHTALASSGSLLERQILGHTLSQYAIFFNIHFNKILSVLYEDMHMKD